MITKISGLSVASRPSVMRDEARKGIFYGGSDRMKAMVLNKYNSDLVLEEREKPEPDSEEVVIRVENCGICGTDVKIAAGQLSSIITLPHVPGHEIAGSVAEVGSNVKGIGEGDRGVVYFYIGCGDCELCRTSRENICYSIKRLGFELDGGYGQYVKLPAYNFCVVDVDLPGKELAVLPDAVATPYHALKSLGDVRIGQKVLIVGAGGLGLHAVQIAGLLGVKAAIADIKDEAIVMAGSLGADLLINSKESNPLDMVMEWTGGKGADVVLEGVGKKQTLEWSLPSLKRGGKLIIMGYDPVNPFPLHSMAMHFNEWTIIGARVSTKQELVEVIKLVEDGSIKPVISKTIPLEMVNVGLEEIKQGRNIGRVVLEID